MRPGDSSLKAGERERNSADATEGMKLFEDTTATERYYNRSIKIRMGTLDWMRKLADGHDQGFKRLEYTSFDELGADCGQWTHKGGWDKKPGSTEAGTRWARQFLRKSGYFEPIDVTNSSFVIAWRDGESRAQVIAMLQTYKRHRR